MKRIIPIILVGLLIQGCATTLKLEPVATNGQKEIFQEGVESVMSAKKALVAIRPLSNTYTSNVRPTIVVSVFNGTDTSFNFSTEDIQAFVDHKPLKVYTYEELAAEVKHRQACLALAAALQGVSRSMNAANAGNTYQSGNYNASVYGSNGYNAYGSGSYTGYTYNPAAAQQAQDAANAQTQAEMRNIKFETERALQGLSSTILKKTTVFPHSWYGGYVEFEKLEDLTQPHDINILVNASGEQHEFLFKQQKVQSK